MNFIKSSWVQFLEFSKDIKLSHSVFSIPFVIVGIVLSNTQMPSLTQIVQILVCVVSARSYAMGMNRLLDSKIDIKNSRTSSRSIPAGKLKKESSIALNAIFAVTFVLTAYSLSPLCGRLSFLLLIILAGYSLMKRVSFLAHWYLGVCLGVAPIAAQIALTGEISLEVLYLGLAVMFWVSGFDLLYSIQDRDFDMQEGLHSGPAVLGIKGSLILSIVSFLLMIALLVLAGTSSNAGVLYYAGILVVLLLLVFEHWMIRELWTDGKSNKINAAFFNANALVSVLFLVFVILDRYYLKGGFNV